MIILVSGATAVLRQHPDPQLGALITPRTWNSIAALSASGTRWAADNDCFQRLDPAAYLRMLRRIAASDRSRLIFVTAPDVVGDARRTARRFRRWAPLLERLELPIALVAQDGLTADRVPWVRIRALFIGGTTAWKEGPIALGLIAAAKARGTWVHVGRVNTERRLRLVEAAGADSIDGTQFSRFSRTYIPRWRERVRVRQHAMEDLLWPRPS